MVDKTSFTEAAEGQPARAGIREPSLAKRTSSLPKITRSSNGSSTGQLPRYSLNAEGSEGDEKREAKATSSDETKPADPATREMLAEVARKGDRKPTVLIVEDTEELAEVIQATLESRGMDVNWVSHGSRGIEQIKKAVPDVLLLDIGLPDMTGWKMLEELREWKNDPNELPVVVVITAYGDPANRLIGKLQGIHSYLIKPFTSDEVERVVEKALAGTS